MHSQAEMLGGIVRHLLASGYAAEIRSGRRARLAYDGSPLGGSLARVSHTLDVDWQDTTIAFEFESGWALTVPEDDAMELEARIDEACSSAAASIEASPRLREPPAAPRSEPAAAHVIERQVLVARCKFCQQITPVDLAACSACGAAKFV
jgi:hypothetical protein